MDTVDIFQVRLNERKVHLVDALRKYHTDPSIYITFSDLAKVGINPQSGYETPLGIYTYPLDAVWDQVIFNNLPFGTERSFVHVLQASGTILDLHSYNAADLERDLQRLHGIFIDGKFAQRRDAAIKDKIAHGWYSPYNYDSITDAQKAKIDQFVVEQKDQLWDLKIAEAKRTALVSTPGGQLWNITRLLAKFFYDNTVSGDALFSSGASKPPVIWNAIFRLLGYVGAVDRQNEGIIHQNEPTQAVFFSKAPLKHLETVANIYDRPVNMANRQIVFSDYDHFISWLIQSDYGDDEDGGHGKKQKLKLKADHWLAYLKQQWSQLMVTGESKNFALSILPAKFKQQMLAKPESMMREMLPAGRGILAPLVIAEIMRHPEMQTPHIWQTFITCFDSSRNKVLQLLLLPAVIALHAKIRGLSYSEAWQVLSEKVIWHVLYTQQMIDLVVNGYHHSRANHDPYPAMTQAKRLIKPLERLLAPQSYTEPALDKALAAIEQSNTSPF